MGIIFVFSSQQRVEVSPDDLVNFIFFKTLHIIEYEILFLLNYRASKDSVIAFVVAILYAISDELHQTFVPTREGKVRDVIIDAMGVTFAWLLLRQKKLKKLALN